MQLSNMLQASPNSLSTYYFSQRYFEICFMPLMTKYGIRPPSPKYWYFQNENLTIECTLIIRFKQTLNQHQPFIFWKNIGKSVFYTHIHPYMVLTGIVNQTICFMVTVNKITIMNQLPLQQVIPVKNKQNVVIRNDDIFVYL